MVPELTELPTRDRTPKKTVEPGTQVPGISVALLTGGGDRPYVFGLATELMSKQADIDLIGSDYVDSPEFHGNPGLRFLNLRGGQETEAGVAEKVGRVLAYYVKLIAYAATSKAKIFHIIWNNKFQTFDRTVLMLYYKLLGKKIVLTVHNVNSRRRDSGDSAFNRLTLGIQYRLADHVFVHTEAMKREMVDQFGVRGSRVTVIPFGINNSIPQTKITPEGARQRLGIRGDEKTILFFGNIAPYKGLEFLVAAFQKILVRHEKYRLIVAGWPKNCEDYWEALRQILNKNVQSGQALVRAEYIPDDDTELYFKAADVLVLPYRYIYQSGVLFLGYSFGLPVLAADVGPLKEEIVEGRTGFVFRAEDADDLALAIERYFASDLFANLSFRRPEIIDYATERHSWDMVGRKTMKIYSDLLRNS